MKEYGKIPKYKDAVFTIPESFINFQYRLLGKDEIESFIWRYNLIKFPSKQE